MHCPKKGRNTHGHSHTHTLADFKPSHDEQKKKTKKIKKCNNKVEALCSRGGLNVDIYTDIYLGVRMCVNLSIYYIFKHLQNRTEKVSRCKICNLCEGIVPKSK